MEVVLPSRRLRSPLTGSWMNQSGCWELLLQLILRAPEWAKQRYCFLQARHCCGDDLVCLLNNYPFLWVVIESSHNISVPLYSLCLLGGDGECDLLLYAYLFQGANSPLWPVCVVRCHSGRRLPYLLSKRLLSLYFCTFPTSRGQMLLFDPRVLRDAMVDDGCLTFYQMDYSLQS